MEGSRTGAEPSIRFGDVVGYTENEVREKLQPYADGDMASLSFKMLDFPETLMGIE